MLNHRSRVKIRLVARIDLLIQAKLQGSKLRQKYFLGIYSHSSARAGAAREGLSGVYHTTTHRSVLRGQSEVSVFGDVFGFIHSINPFNRQSLKSV